MRYQSLLFDLDGTLTDPGIGITNSVMYALEKYHIKVKDRGELYPFIGPPLIDSFMEFYQFSREEAMQAVIYYREYFSATGLFENTVYPGIPKLLMELKNEGRQLIVATSKPTPFAKQILQHFQLDCYFDFIAGSTMDETRTTKAEVIQYALQSCHIIDSNKVVMIGDRKHDIFGAKEWGLDSIGVLYGYGSVTEHQKAGATWIADTVEDIRTFIY